MSLIQHDPLKLTISSLKTINLLKSENSKQKLIISSSSKSLKFAVNIEKCVKNITKLEIA